MESLFQDIENLNDGKREAVDFLTAKNPRLADFFKLSYTVAAFSIPPFSAFCSVKMEFAYDLGSRVIFLRSDNLRSSFITPNFQERSYLLKYLNLTKIIRYEIQLLEKLVDGSDIQEALCEEKVVASRIIIDLKKCRNKKLYNKVVEAVNEYFILRARVDKIIWRMAGDKSVTKKLNFLGQLAVTNNETLVDTLLKH